MVLQTYVNEYRGFGLIAPVVTGKLPRSLHLGRQVNWTNAWYETVGVAGNVGAIFVSRISTALHGAKEERYLLTGSTLFLITTPILIAVLAFVWITEQAKIGIAFTFTYSLMSLVLVSPFIRDHAILSEAGSWLFEYRWLVLFIALIG